MTEMAKNLSGLKVLLAEDDSMNVIVLTKFLQRWGLNCDIARNGQEAIDKAKEINYDVILMDMYMPIKTGIEATKEIRLFDENVQIFALTADATSEMKSQTQESGMNDFVTKPFNPEELFQKLMSLKS